MNLNSEIGKRMEAGSEQQDEGAVSGFRQSVADNLTGGGSKTRAQEASPGPKRPASAGESDDAPFRRPTVVLPVAPAAPATDTLREAATLALFSSEMRRMEREFAAFAQRTDEEKQRRGADDFRQRQLLAETSASEKKLQGQLEAVRSEREREAQARAAAETELRDAKEAVKLAGTAAEQVRARPFTPLPIPQAPTHEPTALSPRPSALAPQPFSAPPSARSLLLPAAGA